LNVAHASRRRYAEVFDLFEASVPMAGGAAAAAGAALGFAVVASVARPAGDAADEAAASRVLSAAAVVRSAGERLLRLADDDSMAYDRIVAAFRLPRGGDDRTQAERRTTIDAALRAATEVPLDMMRACLEGLRAAALIAPSVRASARGEIAVAVELVSAGCRGAGICVAANVAAIRDVPFVTAITAAREEIETDFRLVRTDVLASLASRR
jgi:formiminotetrahydrofolate cyclodeaminase